MDAAPSIGTYFSKSNTVHAIYHVDNILAYVQLNHLLVDTTSQKIHIDAAGFDRAVPVIALSPSACAPVVPDAGLLGYTPVHSNVAASDMMDVYAPVPIGAAATKKSAIPDRIRRLKAVLRNTPYRLCIFDDDTMHVARSVSSSETSWDVLRTATVLTYTGVPSVHAWMFCVSLDTFHLRNATVLAEIPAAREKFIANIGLAVQNALERVAKVVTPKMCDALQKTLVAQKTALVNAMRAKQDPESVWKHDNYIMQCDDCMFIIGMSCGVLCTAMDTMQHAHA